MLTPNQKSQQHCPKPLINWIIKDSWKLASLGWGRIINISSVHGLVASPNKAAYVSAKHGLVGLTKVNISYVLYVKKCKLLGGAGVMKI